MQKPPSSHPDFMLFALRPSVDHKSRRVRGRDGTLAAPGGEGLLSLGRRDIRDAMLDDQSRMPGSIEG